MASGLAVSGQALVPFDYFQSMEEILDKEAQRDSTNVPHAELFESLMPGWAQNTKELDDRVLQSQRSNVERARRELQEALSKPIDPVLSEHWQRLGGPMPRRRQ